MANKSIAVGVENRDAAPVKGNYTSDAGTHIWCVEALATLVACSDLAFNDLADDIQDALRHLLMNEMTRARQAKAAEPMLGSVHQLQVA